MSHDDNWYDGEWMHSNPAPMFQCLSVKLDFISTNGLFDEMTLSANIVYKLFLRIWHYFVKFFEYGINFLSLNLTHLNVVRVCKSDNGGGKIYAACGSSTSTVVSRE